MMADHDDEYQHPWHAYFTTHGDPSVVTDIERPHFTTIAKVATDPEDYGRANTVLLAAAPEMLALLRRVGTRCPVFGHDDDHADPRSRRVDCADDQCQNQEHTKYVRCDRIQHDIADLLTRIEGADFGR